MAKRLDSLIIPDRVIKKMIENIDITRYQNIESGFNLCELKGKIHDEYQCTGTSCMIVQSPKCQKGKFIGTFHTHPNEEVIEPSISDMLIAYKYGTSCIGSHSFIYNVDCFKRKRSINKDILNELKRKSIMEMMPSLRALIPTKEMIELENARRESKKLFDITNLLRY